MTQHAGQRHCAKRKKGRTYATAKLARAEARQFYAETGEKIYLYYCADFPCALHRYIHWTREKTNNRRNAALNVKLVNFYEDQERSGTGTSKQRANAALTRRTRIRKQLPFMVWQDDGGAMHPREMEDR